MSRTAEAQVSPVRIAIYSRTSTVPPSSGATGIEVQEGAARAWCREHLPERAVAVQTFRDVGFSGDLGWERTSDDEPYRPALAKLVEQLGAGQVDIVIVSSPGRLARSPILWNRFAGELLAGTATRVVCLSDAASGAVRDGSVEKPHGLAQI